MIYLDYQATTPLAPEAREAMLRWLGGPDSDTFGNPHSPHRMGRMAAAAVEAARENVAALLPPGGELTFTSGATEALNTVLLGTGGDVMVFATEHAAVLDCQRAVEAQGRRFIVVPVDEAGRADLTLLRSMRTPEVRLIVAMAVNNEIGTLHPLPEIIALARSWDARVLVDAVQAYGRMPLPEADYIAISAHKIHGPKGIGALWRRRDAPAPAPLLLGGGQEGGCARVRSRPPCAPASARPPRSRASAWRRMPSTCGCCGTGPTTCSGAGTSTAAIVTVIGATSMSAGTGSTSHG